MGGVIRCFALGLPAGLGEPMFDGVENRLAAALFGIPAVRGVSFGTGFAAAGMRGSEHNDPFVMENGGDGDALPLQQLYGEGSRKAQGGRQPSGELSAAPDIVIFAIFYHGGVISVGGPGGPLEAGVIPAVLVVTLLGAECVAKSYPDFWDVYRMLGGIIHEPSAPRYFCPPEMR
mgnify:CR=1 FL=1